MWAFRLLVEILGQCVCVCGSRLAGQAGAHHGSMRETKVLADWESAHQRWYCGQACLTARVNSDPEVFQVDCYKTSGGIQSPSQ